MKFLFAGLAAVLILACIGTDTAAKENKQQSLVPYRDFTGPAELPEDHPSYRESQDLQSVAADTFCLVWFDFEPMDWQGWTAIDNWMHVDTLFHVDDFDGLGGGDFGRLVPIEGAKSAWCGIRQGDDAYSCGWISAPGYGNDWDQVLVSDPFAFTGHLEFSYHGVFDSEAEYDFTFVEYASGKDWKVLGTYDGILDTVVTHMLHLPVASTKLRFHFDSDGSCSDLDGVHNTDGACIIDSITVRDDNGLINFEDFESVPTGAKSTAFWSCEMGSSGFGTYTGLANNLQDKDPCGRNFSSQIIFFEGSPVMSDDYPGMPVTPFCVGPLHEEPCQDVTVRSPPIDVRRYSTARDEIQDALILPADLSTLGGAKLTFTVYRDLPLNNRVLYNCYIRPIYDGCPSQTRYNNGYVYFGAERAYLETSVDVSNYFPDADAVYIELDVFDSCGGCWWVDCCEEHTPSPYFDNVRLYRYGTVGPQWSVRNIDLFQDTFPQEVAASPDPMEEYCRADMANDIAPDDEFTRIDPGDSAVVGVAASLAGGLDTLATGEARVYFHCNATFLGPDGKPDLAGPSLEGTYGSYVGDDGDWTMFLCEPARSSAGGIAPNRYCIDLNDSLFTRGYMIEYYFKAYDLGGNSTAHPSNAEDPEGDRYEFTCLPTLGTVPGVLYCDDFHNRGTFDGLVQTYMERELYWSTPAGYPVPDRYDTNGPSSGVSNGIGAYTSVSDASSIFCTAYEKVIHDSGDLNSVTITEGTENSDKSNDAQLLVDWMNVSEHKVGLLVMGDQVAYDLSTSYAAVALELVSTICGVTLDNNSYFELTGGGEAGGTANPLIAGVAGGPYDGMTYYVYGGCPFIHDFDVLGKTGPGEYALQYPDYNTMEYYAGIFTDQVNNATQPLKTVWVGHSYMHIRDTEPNAFARRNFLFATYHFFGSPTGHWVDTEIPKATSLSDNFPNPFNPVTRVKFTLKEKGHVRMRVYDVSGRLVRVLIDEIREAGAYEAVWDGTNNEGRVTASGIYFCRMEATDYERTLKMVMLR